VTIGTESVAKVVKGEGYSCSGADVLFCFRFLVR
jgi:hypothetical protein